MSIHLSNLTVTEWSVLAASGTILIVALYLEDRHRRKKVVSSLQFWALIGDREGQRHGKRLRDVASLLLQVFCFLALVLALARPDWRSSPVAGDSHVLLLDTSAWTLQRKGQRAIREAIPETILDREKKLALAYISTLPAADQVMLTRVDGLVVPLTPFTTDRTLLRQRLSEAVPGLLALNLGEALSFASQAGADVVYIGPARVSDAAPAEPKLRKFRALLVEAAPSHCGIHHVGLARDEQTRSAWTMLVVLRNYGTAACDLMLQAKLSGAALPAKPEHLGPGEDIQAEYSFASIQSEPLTIDVTPNDGLMSDRRVVLQLPGLAPIRIALYTSRPEMIGDLVNLVPDASISLRKEDDYRLDAKDADLIILDRMSLPTPTQIPTLWIAPARERSPFLVKSSITGPNRVVWNARTPVAQGLHSEDLPLPSADVYQLKESDTPVLSVDAGPIVFMRPAQDGHARRAVLGFDPANERVRYEVTVPLLFINLVRWLTVDKVMPSQITIQHAGAGQIDLGEANSLEDVQVMANAAVPLILQNRHVQYFAAQPAVMDLFHLGRKEQLSMTLPEIAQTIWKPSTAQSGAPAPPAFNGIGLWRWLVLGGVTTTLLEWWLFVGRMDRAREV